MLVVGMRVGKEVVVGAKVSVGSQVVGPKVVATVGWKVSVGT